MRDKEIIADDVVNFSLSKVEILKMFITYPTPDSEIKKEQEVDYELHLQHSTDAQKDLVYFNCKVNIVINKKVVAGIITGIIFNVEDLKRYVSLKEKKLILPKVLLITLSSVVISTTRGMLFMETKGTFIGSTVMPLVDPVKYAEGINANL